MRLFRAAASSLRPFGLAVAALLGLGVAASAGSARAAAAAPTQPIPYTEMAAPAAPGDVEGEIASAARANGLDPALVRAVAVQESGLRHAARSNRGALGVMQLTPDTAHDLGVDPHDLHQNIQGGAAYLRALILSFGGDVSKALAAYNAGPGAVQRYGGVPPFAETRHYVTSIMAKVAEGAAGVVTTPLPSQAARAAMQVAAVGARAAQSAGVQVADWAAPRAGAASGEGEAGADPIAAYLATLKN